MEVSIIRRCVVPTLTRSLHTAHDCARRTNANVVSITVNVGRWGRSCAAEIAARKLQLGNTEIRITRQGGGMANRPVIRDSRVLLGSQVALNSCNRLTASTDGSEVRVWQEDLSELAAAGVPRCNSRPGWTAAKPCSSPRHVRLRHCSMFQRSL